MEKEERREKWVTSKFLLSASNCVKNISSNSLRCHLNLHLGNMVHRRGSEIDNTEKHVCQYCEVPLHHGGFSLKVLPSVKTGKKMRKILKMKRHQKKLAKVQEKLASVVRPGNKLVLKCQICNNSSIVKFDEKNGGPPLQIGPISAITQLNNNIKNENDKKKKSKKNKSKKSENDKKNETKKNKNGKKNKTKKNENDKKNETKKNENDKKIETKKNENDKKIETKKNENGKKDKNKKNENDKKIETKKNENGKKGKNKKNENDNKNKIRKKRKRDQYCGLNPLVVRNALLATIYQNYQRAILQSGINIAACTQYIQYMNWRNYISNISNINNVNVNNNVNCINIKKENDTFDDIKIKTENDNSSDSYINIKKENNVNNIVIKKENDDSGDYNGIIVAENPAFSFKNDSEASKSSVKIGESYCLDNQNRKPFLKEAPITGNSTKMTPQGLPPTSTTLPGTAGHIPLQPADRGKKRKQANENKKEKVKVMQVQKRNFKAKGSGQSVPGSFAAKVNAMKKVNKLQSLMAEEEKRPVASASLADFLKKL